jgi:hypothetical protein
LGWHRLEGSRSAGRARQSVRRRPFRAHALERVLDELRQ